MGYYDDHDTRYKDPKQKSNNGRIAGFSAFGGAIVGGALC